MKRNELEKAMKDFPGIEYAYFEQIGSTNDEAGKWLKEGGKGTFLAIADEQTEGRGRSGRKWFTPPNSALAFSLAFSGGELHPEFATKAAGIASVSVCEAVDSLYGTRSKIKWPNDVLLRGEKFCGILNEGHWQGDKLEGVIMGIGINIAAESLSNKEGLNFPATYLESLTHHSIDPIKLLGRVLEGVIKRAQEKSLNKLDREWEERLAYMNEMVTLSKKGNKFESGKILGLNDRGQLKLETNNGEIKSFEEGEIQLRPFVDSGNN